MTTDQTAALVASMQAVVRALDNHCTLVRSAAVSDIDAGRVHGADAFSAVQTITQHTLRSDAAWTLGMGFFGSPDVFDEGCGHWWYRPTSADRPAEPLVTAMHPLMTTYYDFQLSEWWQSAATPPDVHVSEPYVDAAGTNAYVLTGSQAVVIDGRTTGVAAVDVEIGGLQSLWQRHLIALERGTSVVSHEGAVIATNAGNLLGGNVDLDLPASSAVAGTPWHLIGP